MSFALSLGSPVATPGDQVDQLAQHHLVQRRAVVVLRQHTLESRVVRLDGGHGLIDELADGGLLCAGLQVRPEPLRHPEHVLGEVLVWVLSDGGVLGEQSSVLRIKCVRDVLQENQPEHDMLVVGGLEVLAQLVRSEE